MGALAGEASTVVTNDKRLRSETEQAEIDLVPMSADDVAVHLLRLMPDDVHEVLSTLAAKCTKRPVTTAELVEALGGRPQQLEPRDSKAPKVPVS